MLAAQRGAWAMTSTPWTGTIVAAAVAATMALLGLLGGAGPAVVDAVVGSRADLAAGQLWRLVTGPLLHADLGHLARDLPIFAVLAWSLERRLGRAFVPLLGVSLVVPTGAVLLLDASMTAYLGLSGAINTLLIAFVGLELFDSREGSLRGRRRWAVAALGACHIAKLVWEGLTGSLLFPMEMAGGVEPAPMAHLVGAAAGAALLPGLLRAWQRTAAQRRPAAPQGVSMTPAPRVGLLRNAGAADRDQRQQQQHEPPHRGMFTIEQDLKM
jgi:rhomboid family GlyGly-CTERM serine protease